ncbi:MAG: hypothetical protein [Caudoviricetes sp.]|nr:MAG: hypothetical protein [Caudoviricetes sp.]
MSNSKRKCKECGEYFLADGMVKVPAGSFCSMNHAIAYANKRKEKAAEKIRRDKSRNEQAMKKVSRERNLERLKSVQNISFFHKKAQAAFNAFIRERDKGIPCVSCGKPDDDQHQRHASHYRSVGACSSLRYHEQNVHASCSVCNNYLSGNVASYRIKLVEMIGLERVEWIESQPKACKWTREQLEAIESDYKQKLKSLKNTRQN